MKEDVNMIYAEYR